jgi:mRNA-degrading endonuclease RelE of RelBE toxin-antitoxin system
MSYNILLTHRFEKELNRLIRKFPSLKHEFGQLVLTLVNNPTSGIYLGENCYKIRLSIASKGKGKRGGARVITYLFIEFETIYLLSIYDKSEKSDLKSKELKEIIESLDLR